MSDLDREMEELKLAFRAVFATAEGKRVLFWVLQQAAIYRDAFSGEDAATNYILGQQAVGRKVIDMMEEIDPRLYPMLLLQVADMKAMELAAREAAEQQEDDEDA